MRNHHQYLPQEDNPEENQENTSLDLNVEADNPQENQKIPNRPINPEQKPNDWCYKALALSGILFFIIGLGLSYLYAKYEPSLVDKLSPGSFQYISVNLKTDPILDLQIIEHGSSCPSGLELLALNTWPGTVPGCLCNNEGLVASTCQRTNSPQCKIDVPATNPINMYEWGDSVWCGKRAVLGTDYLRQAVCPQGYKECYPGGCFLDSIKDCPITHVEISSTEATNSKLSKPGRDSKERYVVVQRKQGEMPLIDFKITPNYIPCFDQNAFPMTEESFIYPLMNEAKKDECGLYGLDTHFSTKLDSQSSYEAFTQNSFPKDVMDLPHFETNAKRTKSVLSWRVKMKTARNDACLDLDPEYTNLNIETSNWDTSDLLIFLFQFATVSLCILGIITCQCCAKILSSGKWFLFCFVPSVQTCLISIAHFFRFQNIYNTIKPRLEYLAVYDSLECFPEGQANLLLNGFSGISKNLDICYWLSLALFVGAGIHAFFWILCGIRRCFFRKQR